MKIIDHNGRLFGKLSIIDALVIAVVIVMAAALYFKSNQTQTGTSVATQDITYQVLVSGVRTYVADAVRAGDYMYDQDHTSGGPLGQITEVQQLPSSRLAEFIDGTVEAVSMEDGVNLLITVKGSGLYSDGRCLINRVYDLGVNSARNFYTPYAQFTGTVASIG